jgi:hypothetical protein
MPNGYLPSICRALQLPVPLAEYRFAPPRRWRFDWAWPEQRVALEIEGGVFVRGRHSRGAGMVADMEKYNEAACRGWRVVRYTPQHLSSCGADLQRLLESSC